MPVPHFPGSFPLSSAEEVFAWAGRTLGDAVRRVPDGETEPARRAWSPHVPWFERNPTLDRAPDVDFYGESLKQWKLRPGIEPVFDERFDFADWARDSYAAFRRVRDAGGLPAHTRFQVSLPHSIDAVTASTSAEDFEPIYRAFIRQVEIAVGEIAAEVPHEDLAIQWDVPQAACLWSGQVYIPLDKAYVLRELVGHAEWVPEGVELGFHLCFGDGNNEGNVGETRPDDSLPQDAGGLTELANDLVRSIGRPVDFLHFPTYGHWLEVERFAPMADLEVGDADISIGVINLRRDDDVPVGVEHARQRAASARAAIGPGFGISSSCGLGRYTPEQFAAAGELYRELATD
jgi:hypothetical protein